MTRRWFLLWLYFVAGSGVILVIQLARAWTTPPPVHTLSLWQAGFLGLLGVGGLIALVFRLQHRLVWEIILTLTLFLGVWYVLIFILPLGWALVIAALLTLTEFLWRTVLIHNLFYLLGAIGVAIDFAGWLSPELLVVGLSAFVVYDLVVGPPGRLMEELAQKLVQTGIVPGFVILERWRQLGARLNVVIRDPSVTLLGAGDVILPLSLVARAALRGILPALVTLLGLLLGVLVLSRHSSEHPRAALPALAAGVTLPFLILLFLGWL